MTVLGLGSIRVSFEITAHAALPYAWMNWQQTVSLFLIKRKAYRLLEISYVYHLTIHIVICCCEVLLDEDVTYSYSSFFFFRTIKITRLSQMVTLNIFYLVICWTQKVHNDFIFLCSIVLPPVGRSSNHQYHCWNLQDNRAVVRIFIALLRFSLDSLSYFRFSK